MATAPNSVMNYQDILASAYRNLGQVNANADMQTAKNKELLNQRLDMSNIGRQKDVITDRNHSSSRGTLDSSIALNAQKDTNLGYDQRNSGYTQDYDTTIHTLGAQRLAAQNAYDDAKINADTYNNVGGLTANSPGGANSGYSNNPGSPGGAANAAAGIKDNPGDVLSSNGSSAYDSVGVTPGYSPYGPSTGPSLATILGVDPNQASGGGSSFGTNPADVNVTNPNPAPYTPINIKPAISNVQTGPANQAPLSTRMLQWFAGGRVGPVPT